MSSAGKDEVDPNSSKQISESFVKDSVCRYLKEDSFPVIFKEFASEDIRLDFLAYKWSPEGYGIQYFVIECKDSYDLRVKSFTDIIQGQISEYQRTFPRIHVAIPKPNESDKKFYTTLCEFHNVGLLLVNTAGKIEEKIDPAKPAKEEIYAKLGRFSSIAAAFLAFSHVFRNHSVNGPYPRWISTKGDVQYNMWYDEESLRFGVNIEDTSRLRPTISHQLLQRLSSETSDNAEILVRKERYLAPRRREWDMTLKKPFRRLEGNLEDINYILKLIEGSDKNEYNVHVNISIPLWKIGFLPGRNEAELAIESARNSLKLVHDSFSTT